MLVAGWYDFRRSLGAGAAPRRPGAGRGGTYPCRGSGDIGWEYRYVVVVGDDGEVGGTLYTHLEERGFVLQPSERADWVLTLGRREDVALRLGSVEEWLLDGSDVQAGPDSRAVRRAVADREGPMALVGLEPTDETCEI